MTLFVVLCAAALCLIPAFHIAYGGIGNVRRPTFFEQDGLLSNKLSQTTKYVHTPLRLSMDAHQSQYEREDLRDKFLKAFSDVLKMYTIRGVYLSPNWLQSIRRLFPDANERTTDGYFGGYLNVTKVHFLQSLSEDDPRRSELSTIVYPPAERRIKLDKHLKAIDKFLYHATGCGVYTREVFECVVRLGLNESEILRDEKMDTTRIISKLEALDPIRGEIIKGASESEVRIYDHMLLYLNNLHRPLDFSKFGEDE